MEDEEQIVEAWVDGGKRDLQVLEPRHVDIGEYRQREGTAQMTEFWKNWWESDWRTSMGGIGAIVCDMLNVWTEA